MKCQKNKHVQRPVPQLSFSHNEPQSLVAKPRTLQTYARFHLQKTRQTTALRNNPTGARPPQPEAPPSARSCRMHRPQKRRRPISISGGNVQHTQRNGSKLYNYNGDMAQSLGSDHTRCSGEGVRQRMKIEASTEGCVRTPSESRHAINLTRGCCFVGNRTLRGKTY